MIHFGRTKIIILKLGGSVITNKSVPFTFQKEITTKIAQVIREFGRLIIIVHGTGSFGKPPAIKYNYLSGFIKPENSDIVVKVQQKLRLLNLLVMDIFIEACLNVVSLPSSTLFLCSEGTILNFNASIFNKYLKRNIIPIIYSDIVLDEKIGFCALSSDQIVLEFVKKYEVKRVIFASNVDGVYLDDQLAVEPPKLLNEINHQLYSRLKPNKADREDVSGGMYQKITLALEIAKYCPECLIVNGTKPDILLKALQGKDILGTRVKVN